MKFVTLLIYIDFLTQDQYVQFYSLEIGKHALVVCSLCIIIINSWYLYWFDQLPGQLSCYNSVHFKAPLMFGSVAHRHTHWQILKCSFKLDLITPSVQIHHFCLRSHFCNDDCYWQESNQTCRPLHNRVLKTVWMNNQYLHLWEQVKLVQISTALQWIWCENNTFLSFDWMLWVEAWAEPGQSEATNLLHAG